MALSTGDIKKIASLARISLTAAEEERFARELSAVLDYFKRLDAIDTARVDADLFERETAGTVRDDSASDSGVQEEIMHNAPSREDAFIKVKSVL